MVARQCCSGQAPGFNPKPKTEAVYVAPTAGRPHATVRFNTDHLNHPPKQDVQVPLFMAFLRFILVGVCYFTLLGAQPLSVPLTVPAGAPLRLYLTQRAPMHLGAPVSAKLIEPIYAFDRVVIPAGTVVQGSVTKLDPVSKLVRAHALMGGDFTPLHRAQVEFTGLKLPDGRTLPIHTASTAGLPTLYVEPKPPKPPKQTKTATSAA